MVFVFGVGCGVVSVALIIGIESSIRRIIIGVVAFNIRKGRKVGQLTVRSRWYSVSEFALSQLVVILYKMM